MRCSANCPVLECALRPLSIWWMARLRIWRSRKASKARKALKGTRPSKMAKAPTPLHRRPLNRRLPHRRLPRKRVRPTWYSSAFGVTRAHAAPLFSIFFRALWESAFFCSAPAASVKATSISRKFSRESAHICPWTRGLLAARCVKARWVWA